MAAARAGRRVTPSFSTKWGRCRRRRRMGCRRRVRERACTTVRSKPRGNRIGVRFTTLVDNNGRGEPRRVSRILSLSAGGATIVTLGPQFTGDGRAPGVRRRAGARSASRPPRRSGSGLDGKERRGRPERRRARSAARSPSAPPGTRRTSARHRPASRNPEAARRLVEDFQAMDRIEAEQRRRRPALDAGDKVGARPEQEAIGHDLAPARRVSIVELDHEPRKQGLAQPRQRGRIGERARAYLARQSLRTKLRLDVDAEAPPVGFAQAGADLALSERKLAARLCSPPLRGRGRRFRARSAPRPSGRREIAEPRAARRNRAFRPSSSRSSGPNAASTASRIGSAVRRDALTSPAISSSVRPSKWPRARGRV